MKISKKQLQKDYSDEVCQYTLLSNEEEPDNDIIVQSGELFTILEGGDPMEENAAVQAKPKKKK